VPIVSVSGQCASPASTAFGKTKTAARIITMRKKIVVMVSS
jgi:hypothetical protein